MLSSPADLIVRNGTVRAESSYHDVGRACKQPGSANDCFSVPALEMAQHAAGSSESPLTTHKESWRGVPAEDVLLDAPLGVARHEQSVAVGASHRVGSETHVALRRLSINKSHVDVVK